MKTKTEESQISKELQRECKNTGLGNVEFIKQKLPECLITEDGELTEGFNPRIFTYSGAIADINNPPPLEDMAVCLGRIPRFCGNTRTYWPVMGHLLNAANLAYCMKNFEIIGHCLVHDGSEALLGDIPTPFKTRDTRILENRIILNIYHMFNFPVTEDLLDSVDFVDKACLVMEAEEFLTESVAKFFGENYGSSIGVTAIHRDLAKPFLAILKDIADKTPHEFWPGGTVLNVYRQLVTEISEGIGPAESMSKAIDEITNLHQAE